MFQKKRVVLFLGLFVILSLGFVSAGWFGDFFGKITGNVVAGSDLLGNAIVYHFEDSMSDVGNKYSGEMKGAVYDTGYSGKALRFHGNVTSYAILPNSLLDTQKQFTVGFWMKSNGSGDGMISVATSASERNEFLVYKQESLRVYYNNKEKIVSAKINDDKWHYVTISANSTLGNAQVYIDGVLKLNVAITKNSPLTVKGIVLGQHQDSVLGGFVNSESYIGLIDELSIWQNKVLNAEEALAVYNGYVDGTNVVTNKPVVEEPTTLPTVNPFSNEPTVGPVEENGCLDAVSSISIEMEEGYTYYNYSNKSLSVQVRRDTGDYNLTKLQFVVSGEVFYVDSTLLHENELRVFTVAPQDIHEDISLAVAPVIFEGGVSKTCGVSSSEKIEYIEEVDFTCEDLGDKNDVYTYGRVIRYPSNNKSNSISGKDFCMIGVNYANVLIETYCDENNNIVSYNYTCPNGCLNGACNIGDSTVCNDSDGGVYYLSPYQSGRVVLGSGSVANDVCINSSTLTEYGCVYYDLGNYKLGNDSYGCPYGCSNGECVCDSPVILENGKGYFANTSNSGIYFNLSEVVSDEITVSVKGYGVIKIKEGEKYDNLFGSGVSFYVDDVLYTAKHSGISKALVCFMGATVVPVNSTTNSNQISDCDSFVSLLENPTNLTIGGQKWVNDYNWSYDNTFVANFVISDDYSYTSAYVRSEEVVEDEWYSAEEMLSNNVEYGLCDINEINGQTVYICTDPSAVAQESQDVYKQYTSDSNAHSVIWFNDDKFLQIYFYDYRSFGCDSYGTCQQLEDYTHNREQENVLDFLSSLADNDETEYVSNDIYDLNSDEQNFLKYVLSKCSSEIETLDDENESEDFSDWVCKLEPVVCPEYGYQTQTCVRYDYNTDEQDSRETQISCSPGICSGCMVPRWYQDDVSLNNICVPYGHRMEARDGSEEDRIYEGVGEGLNLEVSDDGSATWTLEIYDENVTYDLYQGKEFKVDLIEEGVYFYVKEINYVADGSSENYISLKISELENTYCDIDGELKKQKGRLPNGDWASCQNNYECESNLCSSGECIEVVDMLNEMGGFKSLGVKVLCRFADIFSFQDYDSCISESFSASSETDISSEDSSSVSESGSSNLPPSMPE